MDLTAQVDGYCERLDFAFWAEPVNAVTNLAFLLAALVMWRRVRGQGLDLGLGLGNALVAILAVIGLGSFLFHTLATRWAGIADVLPILVFVLVYFFAANRDYIGLRPWPAFGVTLLFFPYAFATVPLFARFEWLGGSAGYAPIPLLILAYALILRRRTPATARGLAIGAGILIVSLTARTLDEPLCTLIPFGTHFAWHLLNALMLGWMIEVYRRHMLAAPAPRR